MLSLALISLLTGFANPKSSHCELWIDPGHGGSDLGAQTLGQYEKDLTLKWALLWKNLWTSQGKMVQLSREKDQFLSLEDRAKRFERSGCRILVSLHFNSHSSPFLQGTEIHVARPPDPPMKRLSFPDDLEMIWNQFELERKSWGMKAQGLMVKKKLNKFLPQQKIRVISSPLKLLRLVRGPAFLIEIGYLTNPEDLRNIQDSEFQDRFLWGLYHSFQAPTENQIGSL